MPVLSSSSMMAMEHCHTLAFLSISLGSVVLLVAGVYLRRKAHSHSSSQPSPASETEHPSEKDSLSRNWDEKFGRSTQTSPPQPPPYPYASQPQASGSATFPIEPPQHQGSNHSYYSQSPSSPLSSNLALPSNSFLATDANPIFYTAEPDEYLPSPQQLWTQLQTPHHPSSYPGAGRTESSISSKSWFDDNPQTYYETPLSSASSSYTSSLPPLDAETKSGSGSYSSFRSISSLDSDGLPRRRSYTKTSDSGEKMSGEILVGEGGWRRHTRVFGGGSCRACEESEEKARRMGVVLPNPMVPVEIS